MQKQVEVRMDESHLEPPKVDTADSVCSSLCDKIMKNMVLTLTILGEFFFFGREVCYFLQQCHLSSSCTCCVAQQGVRRLHLASI